MEKILKNWRENKRTFSLNASSVKFIDDTNEKYLISRSTIINDLINKYGEIWLKELYK